MTRPKPFPRDVAAFAKSEPLADWVTHAGGAGQASRREGFWYSCRFNGTPERAVESAQAVGFEDAFAERSGFTWLYLRPSRVDEI